MTLISRILLFILAISLAATFFSFTIMASCGLEPEECLSTSIISELIIPIGLISPLLICVFLPNDYKKINGVLRYSAGNSFNGFDVTAMAYKAKWNATDQIPQRAIDSGFISGRFFNGITINF